MATFPSNQNPKVNIAGDYTNAGIDITPSEPYIDRGSLRPNGGGGIQFEDEVPPSERRTPTGQSTLGEAASKTPTPKVNFPVDE